MLPGFESMEPINPRPSTPPATPFGRAMDGSTRASLRWSSLESAQVDAAIEKAASELPEITTDDVWNRLPADFPITKGIATHMLSAKRRGILINTTRVTICNRSRNNNAQRLSVWGSLIYKGPR